MSTEKSTKRKIILGIFIFTGSVFFFITIFMAGRKENLFEKTFTLSAIFNDVNGVKKGNYVYYSGVRGGIVKEVTFVNDSMIRVDMRMDSHLQPLIKKDAKVFISTEGLVGDKIIHIKPLYKSKIAVNDHDTLQAVNPFDMHAVLEKLISTNDHAEEISGNLADLSNRIRQPHKSIVQSLASDSVLADEFTSILKTLKLTGDKMLKLSAHLDKIASDIDLNNGVAGALLKDSALKNEISLTVNNLEKLSENSATVSENLRTTIMDNKNKNAIGVLLRDTMFACDLKNGMESFKKSTGKLDENMEALRHNILLRHYFRKNRKTERPKI